MGEVIELGEAEGYLARPADGVRGGLIVVHEIWGLVSHIRDVADRFAGQGYLTLAPDLLTHAGVPPEVGEELLRLRASDDEAERARFQPMMREAMAPARTPEYRDWSLAILRQAVDRLSTEPGVGDKIGILGFCFGGSYAFALAVADDRIKASLPFYGQGPSAEEAAGIHCPVLAFYGDQDERLMEGLPELRAVMAAAGVDFTAQVYPGTGHAFFNDTNAQTYDPAAAGDAWNRALAFLEQNL